MINAYSLAAEILEGTLDKNYPIIKNEKSSKGKGSSDSREGLEDECDHIK
jgi:hypothetical protein